METLEAEKSPLVDIARDTGLAWLRLPAADKQELRDIVASGSAGGAPPRMITVRNRRLAVQHTPSGYMVVYRPGRGVISNTIISVFTPREVEQFALI